MAKDEDLSLALGLVTVRSDPEDQPEDEVADRAEHCRMIQSPTSGDRNDGFRPLQACGPSDLDHVLEDLGSCVAGHVVRDVAFDPHHPETVYVACGYRGLGLHRSTDGGPVREARAFEDRWVSGSIETNPATGRTRCGYSS
jgi:hypothetical protein